MLGHHRPCIAGSPALDQDGAQPLEAVAPAAVIVEDIVSLDAPHDDVVQRSRSV